MREIFLLAQFDFVWQLLPTLVIFSWSIVAKQEIEFYILILLLVCHVIRTRVCFTFSSHFCALYPFIYQCHEAYSTRYICTISFDRFHSSSTPSSLPLLSFSLTRSVHTQCRLQFFAAFTTARTFHRLISLLSNSFSPDTIKVSNNE